MSDEEKKAIEYWQYIRDTQIYDGYKGQVYAVTLLNLIEKQSKEIEELKEKNEYLPNWVSKKYVSKDKIKAKIEEYDDKGMTVNLANRSEGKTFQQAVHYEVRKVLQSLLEKE